MTGSEKKQVSRFVHIFFRGRKRSRRLAIGNKSARGRERSRFGSGSQKKSFGVGREKVFPQYDM